MRNKNDEMMDYDTLGGCLWRYHMERHFDALSSAAVPIPSALSERRARMDRDLHDEDAALDVHVADAH